MKKKEKKSGFTAFVTLFFVVAKLMKDYGKSGWTIEWVVTIIVTLLGYGIYFLATRRGKSSREKSVDTADEIPEVDESSTVPENSYQTQEPNNESMESTEPAQQFVPAVDSVSRSAEQWKSLYKAGLITKKEYKQKLRMLSGDN